MAKTATVPRAPKATPASPSTQPTIEAQAPLPREFRRVTLAAIAPSTTLNTRAPITDASVRELADSMRTQGLLQPVVVTDMNAQGVHLVLAGRRRIAAAKLLGWNTIDACVLDGGAARSLEVLITENDQRIGPDPLIEAEVVARMLERDGWGYREVAAALGHTEAWVARRAGLRGLTEEARKVIAEQRAEKPSAWPIAWLEEIALLPGEDQVLVLDYEPYDHDDLRRQVRGRMRSLAAVPWPLADEKLYAAAGSCTACTKHSAAIPTLFPEEKTLHVLKTAVCLDNACYTIKRQLTREQAVRTLAAEHKGLRVVHTEGAADRDKADDKAVAGLAKQVGAKVVEFRAALEETFAVKEGTKGAFPIVFASGPRTGQTEWRKEGRAPRPATVSGSREPAQPMSMAEKRKALKLRRLRHVFAGVRADIEELLKDGKTLGIVAADTVDAEHLLKLVAAFGSASHRDDSCDARRKAIAGGAAAVAKRVLEDVLEHVSSRAGALPDYGGTGDSATHVAEECEVLLSIFRPIHWKTYTSRVALAEQELPEPKSWAAEKAEARAKPKAAKAAKGKARK